MKSLGKSRIRVVGLVAVSGVLILTGFAVAGVFDQVQPSGPRPADVMPCPAPCPGYRYEALVNADGGRIIAVASYEPDDKEGGRLFIDRGQVSVDVTDLDVPDIMKNLDVYSIDLTTGEVLKNGETVGPIGAITTPQTQT